VEAGGFGIIVGLSTPALFVFVVFVIALDGCKEVILVFLLGILGDKWIGCLETVALADVVLILLNEFFDKVLMEEDVLDNDPVVEVVFERVGVLVLVVREDDTDDFDNEPVAEDDFESTGVLVLVIELTVEDGVLFTEILGDGIEDGVFDRVTDDLTTDGLFKELIEE